MNELTKTLNETIKHYNNLFNNEYLDFECESTIADVDGISYLKYKNKFVVVLDYDNITSLLSILQATKNTYRQFSRTDES